MWLAGLIQATSVTDGWTDEQNAHSINLYRARTALHGKNSRSHINTEPDGESVVGSTMALCHGPTVGPTPLRGPALRQQLIVAKKRNHPPCIIFYEIWSVDSQENHYNCCHQMSDFKAKMQPIRFRLGLRPKPLGELTAYVHSADPLAGFKGPTSTREGTGR